jgi:hypothetical protein
LAPYDRISVAHWRFGARPAIATPVCKALNAKTLRRRRRGCVSQLESRAHLGTLPRPWSWEFYDQAVEVAVVSP